MSACKYGDPYCPCQDGAACHYEDCGNTKAMKPPLAYLLSDSQDIKTLSTIICNHFGKYHPHTIIRESEEAAEAILRYYNAKS